MSDSPVCQCGGRAAGTWRIAHYRCNFSAFNGYRWQASAYSLVRCERCWARWRTKARYADDLHARGEYTEGAG